MHLVSEQGPSIFHISGTNCSGNMLLSLWEDLHSSALTTPFPEIYYAAHTINSVGCIQNLPDTGYLEK